MAATRKTLGQVAYEAYAEHQGWNNVHGGRIPAWSDQEPEIQEAWGVAVRAALVEVALRMAIRVEGT